MDTAPTPLGASDCGGCAVGVLETARALTSGPPLRNDIIFLMEDGEETSRAGSMSFIEQHSWAKDVRVAINMESMGTRGASLLYVTGPENGWLVGEALNAMPSPVAYSFINDLVWLTGTGGSDLDQFLQAAPVGLGLVYLGNTPAYHTMNDIAENLDRRTLQHQGENVLSLVRHFGGLPLNKALKAPDRVYFNLFGHWVVRYSAGAGIGLALLAVIGFGLVILAGLRRGMFRLKGILLGSAVFLPLVLISAAISGLLWFAFYVF
ncbi:MAG: M28 family peptidase [Desulfobacterales bacterium]|nr:M28 family peptidase [Desulfobacterales bacterium]